MITVFAVICRILSNSVANLFQKKSSTIISPVMINLLVYFLMSLVCLIPSLYIDWTNYSADFWIYVFIAGSLCTIGTIALIYALKFGELSILAPINSYKSIIGLLSAFLLLHELPSYLDILCIVLIVIGSYFVLSNEQERFSINTFKRKDIQLRIFSLICTGIEAAFLKKIILLSSYKISLILWTYSGFICSLIIFFVIGPKVSKINDKIAIYCCITALSLFVMQLTTNFVFTKIPVSSALALFQLSSLVSVYFGYKYFNEKNIIKKILGTIIMLSAATIMLKC